MSDALELRVLASAQAFAAGIDQAPCNGCDACGARCTAGVRIAEPEYQAIRDYLAGSGGHRARLVERQPKRMPYPGTEEADGVFYQACRFRDQEAGACAIYPVRPLICRLFGHVDSLPCPISRVPQTLPGSPEPLRPYLSSRRLTYEEWESEAAPARPLQEEDVSSSSSPD